MTSVLVLLAALAAPAAGAVALPVPLLRQAPERCGPTALAAVMAYHRGDDPRARAEAEAAYSPALRGALVTDLAAAARRAGFVAATEAGDEGRLLELLRAGVPPIVLYANGRGPIRVPHYGVVCGWDPARGRFALADGSGRMRSMRRADLLARWERTGRMLLVVRAP